MLQMYLKQLLVDFGMWGEIVVSTSYLRSRVHLTSWRASAIDIVAVVSLRGESAF